MASYKLIVKNAKVILKTVTNAVLNITGIKDLLTGSGSVDSNTKIDWTLQHYTNTATNFTSTNPILLVGQLGIETDDLLTAPKYKIGDGVTAWNTLPYNSSGGGGLSGLTTNKVLKATSATTAGDSNITDDGTNVVVNGLRIRNISNATYFNASGINGHYWNSFNDAINLFRVKNDGVLNIPQGTSDRIMALDTNKDVVYLSTTIYPSLTELSYGKGVTSAIQTQLDGKVNIADRKGADTYLKTGATTFDARYSTNATAFAATTQAAGGNTMIAFPFIIEETMTFDRIGAEVTVAVPSGVCSLLIYDSVNNIPTNLVLDAGTISVTSATYQEITINKQLTAGLYYLVLWHNGLGNPSFRAMPLAACNKVLGMPATLGGSSYTRIYNAKVYTSAPLIYDTTGITAFSSNNPIISLRRSA